MHMKYAARLFHDVSLTINKNHGGDIENQVDSIGADAGGDAG